MKSGPFPAVSPSRSPPPHAPALSFTIAETGQSPFQHDTHTEGLTCSLSQILRFKTTSGQLRTQKESHKRESREIPRYFIAERETRSQLINKTIDPEKKNINNQTEIKET